MQAALDRKMEVIRLKFNENCDAMGDWTSYVDSLKDQILTLEGRVESMADKLCRCGEGAETAEPVDCPASPALTYEGSEASYHTPPVEGSPGDNSNVENIPPTDRAEIGRAHV